MQKIAYLVIVACTAFVVTSCEKPKLESCPGNCTTITGRLLTSGQQGLSGAPISVYWRNGRGFSSSQLRYKAQATTDNNGKYSLSLYVQDDEMLAGYYELSTKVDNARYYAIDETIGALTKTPKRDSSYQLPPFLIPRKAIVSLTVPNASQIQDYFSVEFVSALGNNLVVTKNSLGGGAVVSVPKQNTPFTTAVEVAADQKLYIRTTRKLVTTYTRTVDSLVVPAGTTHPLTITY
jgi:hypothetical protein